MKIIRGKKFTAERAFGSIEIANMGGITTRLHWTDKPYKMGYPLSSTGVNLLLFPTSSHHLVGDWACHNGLLK